MFFGVHHFEIGVKPINMWSVTAHSPICSFWHVTCRYRYNHAICRGTDHEVSSAEMLDLKSY